VNEVPQSKTNIRNLFSKETTTMFSRFTRLARIGAPQDRRRTHPGRRRFDGTRKRARFRPERLEDRCLLSGISSITEFPVNTPSSVPNGITAGADGNLWFTESSLSGNKIGVINPTTHTVSEFNIPTANSGPRAITAGPDGNLWFTESLTHKIGVINPTTHAISEFATSLSAIGPFDITAGPDGNLWFAGGGSQIGEINPTTHTVTLFTVPTAGSVPHGITTCPDGNLWFTENSGGAVGTLNLTTYAITEYPIPNGGSPDGITEGPDGNLWFTAHGINAIGQISPATGVITEFSIPTTGSGAYGITAGPDGNLWFTEQSVGKLGRINPTTGAITEYPVSYANSGPWQLTTGPDGNLWFTDGGTNSIGVAALATSQLVVTAQPPASVTAGSGFGFTVTAEDSSGNPITTFNGTVTVAIANNPGGAALGGTLSVTASSGVATFSGLTLNKAASGYTLLVTSSGVGEGVTNTISVTPAAPTQLVITQQPPATVKVSSPFGLQALIEDQYGNVVTSASNTVSVAFANNPTGATLGGTLSVTASQGVAAFSNLTINKVGSGYTLQVSSTGLSSAVTNAVNVTKKSTSVPLATPVVVAGPGPLLAPLVLDSPDFWVGLRPKKRFGH
jgi:streptogramin lyase